MLFPCMLLVILSIVNVNKHDDREVLGYWAEPPFSVSFDRHQRFIGIIDPPKDRAPTPLRVSFDLCPINSNDSFCRNLAMLISPRCNIKNLPRAQIVKWIRPRSVEWDNLRNGKPFEINFGQTSSDVFTDVEPGIYLLQLCCFPMGKKQVLDTIVCIWLDDWTSE